MIPRLKPDIFRCIASHLEPGTAPQHNGAHEQTVVYQQTVLNMMKSCKMLHEIFAPKLYTKCRIGDLSSILVSLEQDNRSIRNTEHLHLYNEIHIGEPTYEELLLDGFWPLLANSVNIPNWLAYKEQVAVNARLASRLRHTIVKDTTAFPMLRKVSLGGYEDFRWASAAAKQIEPVLLDQFGINNFSGVPHYLLGLSSVEHMCQSIESGPLALSAVMYKPPTPLKVYTYHVRYPPNACICDQEVAPVIVKPSTATTSLTPSLSATTMSRFGLDPIEKSSY